MDLPPRWAHRCRAVKQTAQQQRQLRKLPYRQLALQLQHLEGRTLRRNRRRPLNSRREWSLKPCCPPRQTPLAAASRPAPPSQAPPAPQPARGSQWGVQPGLQGAPTALAAVAVSVASS
jgi:hypothetical protein